MTMLKSILAISNRPYEALEAMCISALEHRRVDLPMKLELGGDINERMRRELPEVLRKKLP